MDDHQIVIVVKVDGKLAYGVVDTLDDIRDLHALYYHIDRWMTEKEEREIRKQYFDDMDIDIEQIFE